ncbi:ER lumen protein retaining receptor [Cryptosporidium andersoni]|uniref:ER lumen protein retaining receptor n=1 Tax=Cryptosporidium andersoni TaxID=117008 RepID=A0A1J4MCK4_9CRYT|nr:ER lumen protein retaining receptor [Cryptosporidium andersoni]
MEVVNSAVTIISDPEKCRTWVSQHKSSVKAYISLAIFCTIVFFFLSDGDFSFLLTLSSLTSAFSFAMVCLKIELTKSCSGVSLRMMEAYVILIFARLCSIIPFEGYLPYDRSGDWLYQTLEAGCMCLAGTIVYLCRSRYKETYDPNTDEFNSLFLIIPALILALIFHPSLNSWMPADISWTFALYLESVVVLPQLFMFQKERKVVPFTSHFLAMQAVSKILAFIFWISSYSELNDPTRLLKRHVGYWVIVMQIVQLVLMGDFIYHYIRCLTRGVPVQFILMENV